MRSRSIVMAALAGLTGIAHAQDPVMARVRALEVEAAFNASVGRPSARALPDQLDPDFTWTTADGHTLNRTQVLQTLPKPAIRHPGTAMSQEYVYGDLGVFEIDEGRAHVLHVWAKRPEGWKIMAYQEVMSLAETPTVTPGAGKECANPCRSIPFIPSTDTERQVAQAYSKLETAAHAHDSTNLAPMVADEFVAVSSNSNKLQTKRSRIEEFDHAKDAGVAPTPLVSADMYTFGDGVLMISEHKPDRGRPLHVTRVWVKRGGNWQETLSYQTAVRN